MVSSCFNFQFSSVAQSCPTLCDPMDCSTPSFPVHHQPLELAQTHVHWVGDAIQPSHPLSPPSPPAFNLSQHQSLFQWVSFNVKEDLLKKHRDLALKNIRVCEHRLRLLKLAICTWAIQYFRKGDGTMNRALLKWQLTINIVLLKREVSLCFHYNRLNRNHFT